MTYRYAMRRGDDSDLASGRVLRSAPGMPGFPVRLASEIFQRAVALHGSTDPITVWDPCCGSGYLLTILGLLHPGKLHTVVATDLDEQALSLARTNLALLTPGGLQTRRRELYQLATTYGKSAHHEAVQSADRLLHHVRTAAPPPALVTGRADAFDNHELAIALDSIRPTVVVTDVPYGQLTQWSIGVAAHAEPIAALARTLASVVPQTTVLAISCRARRVPLDGIRPVSSFKIGHRAVAFLRAGDLRAPRS